jgi:DNA-binding transcriptional LysR family regulator
LEEFVDRLDELTIFAAIVETGSLAAAARKLRRSPPAVTRILAALEARVATRLVERTTRRLSLTEAGRRLAPQAAAVLAAYDEATQDIAADQSPAGLLRVTAPMVFGSRHVTPLVTAFQTAHPLLRVELVLADRNLDLVDEGLDIAVRIGRLADSSLIARRVGQVARVLVASPDYIAVHGPPGEPAALSRHHLIYTASRPDSVVWRFGHGGRTMTVAIEPRLIINQVEASLAAARAGHGIAAALSYQVAEELVDGRLVRLLAEWEPPPLPVHLVVPGGRHMPARTRLFLEHAARGLAGLPVLRPEVLSMQTDAPKSLQRSAWS